MSRSRGMQQQAVEHLSQHIAALNETIAGLESHKAQLVEIRDEFANLDYQALAEADRQSDAAALAALATSKDGDQLNENEKESLARLALQKIEALEDTGNYPNGVPVPELADALGFGCDIIPESAHVNDSGNEVRTWSNEELKELDLIEDLEEPLGEILEQYKRRGEVYAPTTGHLRRT